jgi:hypothetical protein
MGTTWIKRLENRHDSLLDLAGDYFGWNLIDLLDNLRVIEGFEGTPGNLRACLIYPGFVGAT